MHCRIQLIRHGQVHRDWRNRIYGCLDVPLSEHGEQEARRAAGFLESMDIDAVFATGLSRSIFGAQCIASSRDIQVQTEGDLREIERGTWANLTFAELEESSPGAFEAWNADPWTRSPAGGENLNELFARVTGALDRIAVANPGKSVAIVAHRHVLRCAMAKAIGKAESLERIIPTGSVLTLDWSSTQDPVLVSAECFESKDN